MLHERASRKSLDGETDRVAHTAKAAMLTTKKIRPLMRDELRRAIEHMHLVTLARDVLGIILDFCTWQTSDLRVDDWVDTQDRFADMWWPARVKARSRDHMLCLQLHSFPNGGRGPYTQWIQEASSSLRPLGVLTQPLAMGMRVLTRCRGKCVALDQHLRLFASLRCGTITQLQYEEHGLGADCHPHLVRIEVLLDQDQERGRNTKRTWFRPQCRAFHSCARTDLCGRYLPHPRCAVVAPFCPRPTAAVLQQQMQLTSVFTI